MKGNAIIKRTSLGFEDHGLMTAYLHLEQPGAGQGFGGYRLDAPKDAPSPMATFFIARVLRTVGVDDWEQLPGKHVRVVGEDFGKILGIGHILEDKWFYPEKEIQEFLEKYPRE